VTKVKLPARATHTVATSPAHARASERGTAIFTACGRRDGVRRLVVVDANECLLGVAGAALELAGMAPEKGDTKS